MVAESKVVYQADGRERVIRGVIVESTDWGIKLQRRDGTIEIARAIILRIEKWDGEGDATF